MKDSLIMWEYKAMTTKDDPYTIINEKLNDICKDYLISNEEKQKDIVDKILLEIRKINIFPIYYFNEEGIIQEIEKAIDKKVSITNNIINIFFTEGFTLLDFLFPNLHFATSNHSDCIYNRFFDDNKLKYCIKDFLNNNLKIGSMRQLFMSRARYKWPTPINFSPMRAKAIFEKYCPINGVIYDYCAGYGGRMLGALSSNNNYTYIATDPNKETFINLQKLGNYISLVKKDSSYKIYNNCAEEFLPKEKIDFAFSCPPFFDLENYSNDYLQSNHRYVLYDEWLELFVRRLIQNIKKCLKKDGLFGVDLSNFYFGHKIIYLQEDWIRIALEEKFFLKEVLLVQSHSRKKDIWQEKILIFSLNPENSLSIEDFKKLNFNQEIFKQQKKINYICQYDPYGNLIKQSEFYSDFTGFSKQDINKSNKNKKMYKNMYFRLYSNPNDILHNISTKVFCKIDNIFFESQTDCANYVGVSRQAISQAKQRKQKKINGKIVEWIE